MGFPLPQPPATPSPERKPSRAADDFDAIRERIAEIRQLREEARAAERDSGPYGSYFGWLRPSLAVCDEDIEVQPGELDYVDIWPPEDDGA